MTRHTRRTLMHRLSIAIHLLVILTMVGQMLLPLTAQAAPVPTPYRPDYSDKLLAVSDTLEQSRDGELRFPYPETRPGSARGTVLPLAQTASPLLDSALLPDLPAVIVSGVGSRSGSLPDAVTPPAVAAPTLPDFASPLRLTISGYSGPLALESQNVITTTYLPIVFGGPPAAPVVGEKAIFDQLLPDTSILATDVGFSAGQISQVQTVIDAEQAAIAALNAEADVIINDESKTLTEKRAAIAAMDYNGRLAAILQGSQTQLENQLGAADYNQLTDWLEQEWRLFKAQREAIRATLSSAAADLTTSDTPTETCQIFDVFATRSTYTDYSADLPDKYVKFANLGWEYSEGYTNTTIYSITVSYNGKVAKDIVVKDIVWNHNDNYWNTITDTVHPRRMFTDLAQGMPEAEAAYFDGYNSGLNEFGQQVTNPAGLNVSQQAATLLGLGGSGWVEVMYPWNCVPEEFAESRLEQTWGVNDWSASVAHLVNPVTGNQANWFRDLHIPAPGIEIDIVRYYNSQDGEDGIFGRGWSSEIDMRVYPQPNGSYKVRFKDGRRGTFSPDGSGGFVGSAGVFADFALLGGGFVLTSTDQFVYTFDGGGRLQTIGDMVGNQLSLTYSGGNPVKLVDPAGRELNLTFDSNGHATQLSAFDGRTVTYSYGAALGAARVLAGASPAGNIGVTDVVQSAPLLSVTDTNGGVTNYQYDPATQMLTQASDAEGIVFLQNIYDNEGRVVSQANYDAANTLQAAANQGKTTFNFDPENLRATSTDKLGHTTTYIYDKKMRLVEEIDALGHSIKYKYDANDNMVEKTDKRGFTWKYAYDDRGNMIQREDPIDGYSAAYYGSDVTTWEYNDRNQPVKMTNALGEVTRYEYDDKGNLIKAIEANGATTTSAFNSRGQMISMTDAEGRITTFEYDSYGNRNKITDPMGGVTLINYDDAGHVLSRTDAEGNTTNFEYDGNGNVTKIIDAFGRETRREYDGNNKLTRQIDRRGAVYEFKYDDELNLIEQKDSLGNVIKYEYDAMQNRTKMIDAKGNVTTYEYDPLYRITKSTDPAGYVTRYEYDENGNMTKAIDAMGGETRFVYDAVNRRKFVYDALNYQTEFCYDALDRVISVFDPRRALTRYEYDEVGNLARVIDPLGAATIMGYDLLHNRLTTTDPNGHTTTNTYDDLNRPVSQTDPLGNVFQTGYDKIGNTTAITDANGNVTTFEYNANQWLTRSANALGKSSTFTYDEEGNQLTATDEEGNTTATVYDLIGRPIQTTDALGFVTKVTYDANSNQVEVTDANNLVSRSEYDKRDLPVKEIDPLGNETSYEYDGLKRPIKIADANGKITAYTYDAISRLIATTDAANNTYRFSYDPVGNQTVITDSTGIATRFEYNFLNQLVKEINPLTRTWEYHYDLAGNMTMQVDGKWQPIHYDYDAANRLIRTRYPDGKAVEYEYDNNGNQLKMVDWNGVFTETYDALNRRISATDYKGRQIAYTYDDVSNPASLTYPDGKRVTYNYNGRYELETMTDPAGLATSYTYDPIGLLTEQARPNNTSTQLTYDGANRLQNLSNTGPGGAVIASFDFTLDNIGNRTQMVETRSGVAPVTYDYGYDDIYQLISINSNHGQDIDYTYDPVGNRSSVDGAPKPTSPISPTAAISLTYEYDDLNSILQAGDATFNYDDNGNRLRAVKPLSETKYASAGLTGTLITDYVFDVENRLVEARETIKYETIISGSTVYSQAVVMESAYSYDGMGRRVAKLVQNYNLSGTPTEALLREYVYNGLNVVAEYEYVNGATAPNVNHYYYANGEKIAIEKMPDVGPTKKYWYAYDALGTAAALLDESGLAVAEYHHDEFGRLIMGDSLLNRYLFTGQEYDPETGFIHFFARYYDPEVGVWLTQDIQRGDATNPASLHRYMYVHNNPINDVDLLGYISLGDVGNFLNDTFVEPVKEHVVKPIYENVVKPTVETISNGAEAINETYIQPAVKEISHQVDNFNQTYIQPAKEKLEESWNYVNENYVQPTLEVAKDTIQSTREAITKAADWIQENRMAVMATVGFVVGVAAGFVAAGVFCAATVGIGCAIMAGAAAGLVAGGLAAGGTQMFANQFDSSAATGLFDNVLQSMAIGGVAGAIGGGIGGAAQYLMSGSSSLSNVGSKACNFNSFAEGTLVSTSAGLLPIEDVALGDQLLAYNEAIGETGLYPVTFVTSHPAEDLLALSVGDDIILTTPGHPIWVEGKGWIDAEDIVVGDRLKQADGELAKVGTIERIQRPFKVFNFTVEGVHNYFVTDSEYLVHNCEYIYRAGKPSPSNLKMRPRDLKDGLSFQNSLSKLAQKFPDATHYFRVTTSKLGDVPIKISQSGHVAVKAAPDIIKNAISFVGKIPR